MWSIIFGLSILGIAPSPTLGNGEPTPLTVNIGESIPLNVRTLGRSIDSCELITPDNNIVELSPEENDGRYKLLEPGVLTACSVLIQNAAENDSGVWEIYAIPSDQNNDKISQLWKVTINGGNQGSVTTDGPITEESTVTEEAVLDNTIWLSTITHRVRTDSNVTIALSKQHENEECFLRYADGTEEALEDIQRNAIRTYGSSIIVQCRVVIGPILDESLLGNWALCGQYQDSNEVQKRCQPVVIRFNDRQTPDATWRRQVLDEFDHAVHFTGEVSPSVRGDGTVQTCHIITPFGEDLALTADSNYPFLNRSIDRDQSFCSITVGPIDSSLLGSWELYGTFLGTLWPFNEVRLPMNFFLYDEENPYNQAYNVTNLAPIVRVVHIGNTIEVEVAGSGEVRDCIATVPSGQVINAAGNVSGVNFVDVGSRRACRLSIGPITENMLGHWQLSGKFFNRGTFSELRLPFQVLKEDPANPVEEDRIVSYLNPRRFVTKLGGKIIITIDRSYNPPETCHIRTPNGLQYKIMERFNVTNVEILDGPNTYCGVAITVASEDEIGTWTLISREGYNSEYERRFVATIVVEEEVRVLPVEATVAEGNELHIRLEQPTSLFNTCQIFGPTNETALGQRIIENEHFVRECGFIVKNVSLPDTGNWTIQYGNKILYKGISRVNVTGRWEANLQTLVWTKDTAVNESIGPKGAVYCKIEDPAHFTVFDHFGQCWVDIPRVTIEHQGTWRMTVGMPGHVVTNTYNFTVLVQEQAPKPRVEASVKEEEPALFLTCSLKADADLVACKFRTPNGNVLLASPGVGEDRYSFHDGSIEKSEGPHHECGLRIAQPEASDIGIWRCAMETAEGTYYGFLSAFCPWLAPAPGTPTKPTLTADFDSVTSIEYEPAHLSCSVPKHIRYCYFRSNHGTVINVSPGASTNGVVYKGAGFDAGECGAYFPAFGLQDAGIWSCHVGFLDATAPEQVAFINVSVHDQMKVKHEMTPNGLEIFVIVDDLRPAEYCRFVRADGLGFTLDNLPEEYEGKRDDLNSGTFILRKQKPADIDMKPWIIAVRVKGLDAELVRTTNDLTKKDGENGEKTVIYVYQSRYWFLICLMLTGIILACCFVKKDALMLGIRKQTSSSMNTATSLQDPSLNYKQPIVIVDHSIYSQTQIERNKINSVY